MKPRVVFEALPGGEDAAHPDPESSRTVRRRTLDFSSNLRLRRLGNRIKTCISLRCREECLPRRHPLPRSRAAVAFRESAGKRRRFDWPRPERARHSVLSLKLIETQGHPHRGSEKRIKREIREQKGQRNEQLRDRLGRYESHPFWGRRSEGEGKSAGLIDSMAARSPSNGDEPHL